jgi:hypothetical protein
MPGTARPRVRIRENRLGFSPCNRSLLMATKNTSTKRRQPGRKAEDIHMVWKHQAPDAEFAGKPLTELEAALVAVQQANEDLRVSTNARSAAVKTRDEKLKYLADMLRVIVKGVQSHPDHGEDSSLYRAMGFIPYSERNSGLTRRTKSATGTGNSSAGSEETAA